MTWTKKVAIIGAGPSGLVTAKTLLQNFPPGTFQPVIFEKKSRVGGLWAVDYPSSPGSAQWSDAGSGSTELNISNNYPDPEDGGSKKDRALIDPWMRTNLSRFSVAFSDLSWETALDGKPVPVFPCAWEVRRYLEKYAGTYIPRECFRLGKRVLKAERRKSAGWEVSWVDGDIGEANSRPLRDSKVQKEEFDILVVASGHFGTPHIPPIPGIESFPNTLHSSELQSTVDIRRLLDKSPKDGKLVVVGGSMSGVETATSLALHLSSMSSNSNSSQTKNAYEVWHISTGPFWVLPNYLPHRCTEDPAQEMTIPFVPLDLSLYDLARRPPGANGVTFGPVTHEQIAKKNGFFESLLGQEYSKTGGVKENEDQRPPWVGISDHYAEFVRSGAIKTITGRASSMSALGSGHGTINLEVPHGSKYLEDVSAIVMATGFKPSNSLSFLPEKVLSTLEYSPEDDFLPLVLDSWSTAHSEIPDLGFVGFYRGAFWGPAELQANSLAQKWAAVGVEIKVPTCLSAAENSERAAERQRVREYRDFRPTVLRGQFPLGDYVGLMETMATSLDRQRIPLGMERTLDVQPPGPVIPARYPPVIHKDSEKLMVQRQLKKTMKSLRDTLDPEPIQDSTGITAAIFRALHGQWDSEKGETSHDGSEDVRLLGTATFHPRYPSSPDYQAEYLCEEVGDKSMSSSKNVLRFSDLSRFPGQAGISVWSVDDARPNAAAELISELQVQPVGKVLTSGEILVEATSFDTFDQKHKYKFYFDRVAITSWVHSVFSPQHGARSTQYSRATAWPYPKEL